MWLQAGMPSGTVVQEPGAKVAVVTLASGETKRVMIYDANKGMFVPAASR